MFVLQRLGVTVAGVYGQLYRHCSEQLENMAPADSAARARARETVHICEGTRETESEQEQSGFAIRNLSNEQRLPVYPLAHSVTKDTNNIRR
jgi:hypothetical protein